MIMYVMGFLTQIQIQPTVMYIVMVLEIIYVLIRFLLIVIPKENKFHQILLNVFKGLRQVQDDIQNRFPIEDKKKDDELESESDD